MSELEQRFNELAAAWEAHLAANRESSNPYRLIGDPSFEALVALGPPAVPLIIQRYRQGSLFWGAVLRRITGLSEYGDGVVGNLEATRRSWLAWWEQQGARAVH